MHKVIFYSLKVFQLHNLTKSLIYSLWHWDSERTSDMPKVINLAELAQQCKLLTSGDATWGFSSCKALTWNMCISLHIGKVRWREVMPCSRKFNQVNDMSKNQLSLVSPSAFSRVKCDIKQLFFLVARWLSTIPRPTYLSICVWLRKWMSFCMNIPRKIPISKCKQFLCNYMKSRGNLEPLRRR